MLGDQIESALRKVGITAERANRVSRWIGVPCHCKERKQKLNALHSWAKRVLSGAVDRAEEYLETILSHVP